MNPHPGFRSLHDIHSSCVKLVTMSEGFGDKRLGGWTLFDRMEMMDTAVDGHMHCGWFNVHIGDPRIASHHFKRALSIGRQLKLPKKYVFRTHTFLQRKGTPSM